ncbi:MAG TPA: carbonic anhydrase family protein [Propionibacteriaceae bacterium]|nr:carbonic anhydrase family protein [Propionibacteriaceae bacterium]
MIELSRRDLLKAGGAAAAGLALGSLPDRVLSLLSAPEPPAGAWNHDPASPIGPSRWDDIGFPTCGDGISQSPVNIQTAKVASVGGSPLHLRYGPSELAVENTGHVIEVPIPADVENTLQIGGDRYRMTQYHFHAPSEHAVNGRLADLEAHFVHTNASGGTAVVGLLFHIGHHGNEVVDRILLAAPADAGEEADAGEASPAELFLGVGGVRSGRGGPLRVNSFYAYDGSLTTPGCTQGVRWSVLANGGQVSPAAITHLHGVIARFPNYNGYPNNNRPVQALNGRVIRHRGARHE